MVVVVPRGGTGGWGWVKCVVVVVPWGGTLGCGGALSWHP